MMQGHWCPKQKTLNITKRAIPAESMTVGCEAPRWILPCTLGIHEPTQVLALIDSVQEKRKENKMQLLSQRIFDFKQGDRLK